MFYVVLFQGSADPNNAKQQEERMQQMEEAKHSILAQALSQDARARCKSLPLLSNLFMNVMLILFCCW